MSEFFKILEQVERDRAVQKQARARHDHVAALPPSELADGTTPSEPTIVSAASVDGIDEIAADHEAPRDSAQTPHAGLRERTGRDEK